MILRTPLGRFYQSWSADDGTSWSRPEPTALASALAPAALGRIPDSDDLLIIWNQASPDEIQRGMQRHRLSSAVSKDGGATWRHTGNVFSIFLREGDRAKTEADLEVLNRYLSIHSPGGYKHKTGAGMYWPMMLDTADDNRLNHLKQCAEVHDQLFPDYARVHAG